MEILYKVYALLDENKCITSIEGTSFNNEQELIDRGYILIDEGSEWSTYCHCQPNFLKNKYRKPTYDEKFIPNYKLIDNKVLEVTDDEKYEWYIKPQELAQEHSNQQAQLQEMMLKAQQVSFLIALPDEEAVKIPLCYPTWQSYIGKSLKQNERIEHDGKLWKVRQNIAQVQEHQSPSTETASLYEVINEAHVGTIDDPIPYDMNLAVFKDKYYIEEDVLYKCIRDSGNPLYTSCESLVGNYFEVVSE